LQHFTQEQAETLVRTRGTPAAIGGRVNAVVESWSAASGARRLFLAHEIGVDQLRKVLADRVVIEAEVLREFGNIDRRARAGDIAKDRVTSGVAERACLFLQRRNRRMLGLRWSLRLTGWAHCCSRFA